MRCAIVLLCAAPAVAFACAYPVVAQEKPMPQPPLMHLCEPADPAWDQPLPQPQIPPPPTNKGLTDRGRLRPAPPLEFKGEAALEAEAAKPDGFVTGQGTAEDPWVIRDLLITGVTDQWGLQVHFIKRPLIIENCLVDGAPPSEYSPAPGFGISVIDSDGVVIRNCQVSRCFGIYGGGSALKNLLVENCYVYSTSMGIMTSGGSHCTARGNYVRDSTKYGIFLYNGTDHVIENNYVKWTGREGIGTNGKAHRHKYLKNVILHTGWTAVNVEGETDDYLVEGNLVVDSHYGIILGGNRSVCRSNQVFYGSQAGLWVFNCQEGLTIENNLVVASGSAGIDIYHNCANARVIGNTVLQSSTGINLSGPGATVERNEVSRFYFGITVAAPGCAVRDNHVYNGRNLLHLIEVKDPALVVSGNRLHHCIHGAIVQRCQGITFSNNRMEAVGQAFSISDSSDLVIRDSEMVQLAYAGIQLSNSTNCRVENNRFLSGVVEALRITGGSGNLVEGNTVADIQGEFSGAGLLLVDTKGNRITGNTFLRCAVAVAWQGKDNRDNVMQGNRFENNRQDVVAQEGAENVEQTNQTDVSAVPRK